MSEGIKHDQGKPSISLIPSEAIEDIAKALTYGAKKYGVYQFRKGLAHTRLIDAAQRHILAHLKGEDIDSESGNTHISHAAASLCMLLFMMHHRPDLDDRWKGPNED